MFLDYAKERYALEDEKAKAYLSAAFASGAKAILKPWGFLIYLVRGDALLILDAYVKPKSRGQKRHLELFNEALALAQSRQLSTLLTFSMKQGLKQRLGQAAIAEAGFQPLSELEDRLVFIRGTE